MVSVAMRWFQRLLVAVRLFGGLMTSAVLTSLFLVLTVLLVRLIGAEGQAAWGAVAAATTVASGIATWFAQPVVIRLLPRSMQHPQAPDDGDRPFEYADRPAYDEVVH
jgi:hypothetical protein